MCVWRFRSPYRYFSLSVSCCFSSLLFIPKQYLRGEQGELQFIIILLTIYPSINQSIEPWMVNTRLLKSLICWLFPMFKNVHFKAFLEQNMYKFIIVPFSLPCLVPNVLSGLWFDSCRWVLLVNVFVHNGMMSIIDGHARTHTRNARTWTVLHVN